MPRPSKKAAQALAQRHAGQGVFSTTPKNISESDDGSAYHTSDGKTEQDSSDEEDANTQAVNVMQALMADYLPAEMKTRWEASEQVSSNSTMGPCIININISSIKYKKRKISNRLNTYEGDSQTSEWRHRNKFRKASKGCAKLDSFFVSCSSYGISSQLKLPVIYWTKARPSDAVR
jgi:hypothetical protein